MQKKRRTINRVILLRFVALTFFIILFGRVSWLQAIASEELSQKAVKVRTMKKSIDPKRGMILDSTGKVLASSVSTRTVYLEPEVYRSGVDKQSKDSLLKESLKGKIKKLAQLLGIKEQDLAAKLSDPKSKWLVLARQVDMPKVEEIKKLDLPGIGFVEDSKRYYPMGSLMASVLGIVTLDGHGAEGLELGYDKELYGEQGYVDEETDTKQRGILGGIHSYKPPRDGNNLVLTIDSNIQYIVERQLDDLVVNADPKSATIIVMDPKTGRILAMGNRPTFDPNQYTRFLEPVRRNLAITTQYEPGSTYKIVTAATALEEGTTSPDKLYEDHGYLQIGGQRIRNWDSGDHGTITMTKGMQKSSNVVLAQVGLELSKHTFFKYIYGFGFGQQTGIDLPGEAIGQLLSEERTTPFEQATMAFGQANAATPLQMITAVSAVANGGVLYKPYVVEKITDSQGKVLSENRPVAIRQVISKSTSDELRRILEKVVSDGTGGAAKLEGYRVAGKTGTAQKVDENGKYSETDYIGSFVGFAPADDPKLAVIVIVDSARKNSFRGGEVAAPRFKAIMEQALQYLGVPREGQGVTEPPLKVTPNKTQPQQYTPEREPGPGEGVVPDLTGLTMSEVGELLSKQKLRMYFIGSGLAVSQDFPPGKVVQAGTVVTVKFEP